MYPALQSKYINVLFVKTLAVLMNLNAIELRFLRGLVAIARTGTFELAAQQMNVTQSALSQQMKELSERLGVVLFERQGRRAVLTETGRDLVQRLTPVIEQLNDTLLQSTEAARGVTGRLRIGATQTYLGAMALPAALELINLHPDLRIDTRQQPAQRLLADLLEREIDVALFPDAGPHDTLEKTELLTEHLAVIGLPLAMHQLGGEPTLKAVRDQPLAVLNRQFLMRQNIDRQVKLDRLKLDIRLEVSSMDDLVTAAGQGHLLAIGSGLACLDHPTLVTRSLHGKFMTRSAALYWRRGRTPTLSVLSFQAAVLRISARLNQQLVKRNSNEQVDR
jgi:LysR family cyn operon transcriptional activator